MKRTRQYSRAIDSDEPVVSVRGALLTPRARMTAIIGTLLCVATVSAAQEVHGSLRRADGSTPASGAIIEVRRVPDGALVSRTIADFAGRFRLGRRHHLPRWLAHAIEARQRGRAAAADAGRLTPRDQMSPKHARHS